MVSWRNLASVASLIAVLLTAAPISASAGSTLLYDAADGSILYAEEADQPWYAASLTKMMTAYLLFEDWTQGRVKPADKIKISAYANAQPPMRLGLGVNKEITFDDAAKALIMVSANDIAVAIAEALSGSEEAFVQRMNDTAYRLRMYGTRYINPNGLPGEGQYTTAKDLSLLAAALQRDFPQYRPLFALKDMQIGKRKFATHNPVLNLVPGGDGLKTGFTCSAGYNIVASAERNGQRLVAIVLGAPDKTARAQRVMRLFEFGFQRRGWKALSPAPPVEGLPETPFDRQEARAINLDKRYIDCRDPVPTLMLAAAEQSSLALAPGVVAEAAVRAAAAGAAPQLAVASPEANAVKGRVKSNRVAARKARLKQRTKALAQD